MITYYHLACLIVSQYDHQIQKSLVNYPSQPKISSDYLDKCFDNLNHPLLDFTRHHQIMLSTCLTWHYNQALQVYFNLQHRAAYFPL